MYIYIHIRKAVIVFRLIIDRLYGWVMSDETIHKKQLMSKGEIDMFDRYHPSVAHHDMLLGTV